MPFCVLRRDDLSYPGPPSLHFALGPRLCYQENPGEDVFAKPPQHALRLSDLELASSSGHRFLIDVSTLVNDAPLDVSSLNGFSCDMNTADVMTAVASPIERLQLVCDEAEGFHCTTKLSQNARVLLTASSKLWRTGPAITRWLLKPLIAAPLVQKDDWWCEHAIWPSPNLPHLGSVIILGCYKRPAQYRLRFWRVVLSRRHFRVWSGRIFASLWDYKDPRV